MQTAALVCLEVESALLWRGAVALVGLQEQDQDFSDTTPHSTASVYEQSKA